MLLVNFFVFAVSKKLYFRLNFFVFAVSKILYFRLNKSIKTNPDVKGDDTCPNEAI